MQPLTQENIKDFLDNNDNFLFDCDGVLWLGNSLIEGADSVIELLKKLGKKVFFVTNNSSKSRVGNQKKIQSFGISCEKDEVYSSSFGVAHYLHKIGFDKKAYVIGDEGIVEEFNEFNIKYLHSRHHEVIVKSIQELQPYLNDIDLDVRAVVVGIDIRLTYTKIAYALHVLLNTKNCLFISTNLDQTYPVDGCISPGAGSCVSGLITSYGKEPINIGKPTTLLFDIMKEKNPDIDPKRTVMIGDRLDTDILFGINNQIKTLLVFSGISTYEEASDPANKIVPNYTLESIGKLKEYYDNL
jgi:phosphoglycolate/pyridoxal phosphate phosphatase family enzyme